MNNRESFRETPTARADAAARITIDIGNWKLANDFVPPRIMTGECCG